jgi:hypothetical protein
MRLAAGILLGVMLGAPAGLAAQGTIGEFRLLGVAGLALRPDNTTAPSDFPPPGARGLFGVSASLSFVHDGISLGPEAMVLRGSDRRMYELGGVARLHVGRGQVRPFILVGAGWYSWDRKMVQSFNPSAGAVWTADKTYFTGNAGGGFIFGTGRAALVLELRGHKSLGHDEFFGSRDMFSISAGGRVSW